jgi:GH18 family chitinase
MNAAAAAAAAASITNTRIWVTIGGMMRSQAFPMLKHRAAFLSNLVTFCKENRLYGVNLYWDDPKTRQDLAAYSQLIKETATVLHKHGILISITTRQFFSKDVIDHVDFINLLAFDLIQKGDGSRRPHHAAMESVSILVDNVLFQGDVPPSKLLLGIPAYARHEVDPATNVRTFAELVEDGYRELTQSSYKGYLFDSPGRVKRKVKFAKERRLGGVFLWELGQDKQVRGAPGGMLLEAIAVGQYKTLQDEL